MTRQQDGSGDIDTYEVMQLFRKIGEKIPRKAAQAIIEQFSLVCRKPPILRMHSSKVSSPTHRGPPQHNSPTHRGGAQYNRAFLFEIQMLAVDAPFVRDVEQIAGWPLQVTHRVAPFAGRRRLH